MHRSPTPLALATSLALCASPAAQGGTEWIPIQAANGPPRRVGAPFAYQPPEHVVLMFGGSGTPAGFVWPTGSETWEYDGRRWTLLDPPLAPPPRAFMAMAFDEARQRMVMFGGRLSGVPMNDTWEWDGTTWREAHPPTSPPPQSGHSMAYDALRRRIVLFSGDAAQPDTWLYDGTDWELAAPVHVPPGRGRSALVWDARRGRVVMFGGTPNLDDTWEWDGTDWTQMTPQNAPPGRSEHAMAWDAGRQRTVMFGGISSSAMVADTWEWDGTDWMQRMTATSPSPRDGHGMAYDLDRGVVAMFGGSTDTWEYGPTQPGDYQPFGQGCAGPGGVPALGVFAGGRPYAGGVLILEATNLGTGSAVLTIGASRGSWQSLALPLDLGPIGAPGCRLLASIELLAPLPNLGGTGRLVLPIPDDPILVGKRFYDQVVVVTRGAPALALSNGGAGLIGAK